MLTNCFEVVVTIATQILPENYHIKSPKAKRITTMSKLNFPEYPLTIKEETNQIYDIIRKKYVANGPEEVVRQYLIHFLINDRKYPKALINVEKQLKLNKMKRRTDLLVYNKDGQALMIAECKAPQVPITQKTFEQIARYNLTLKVKYLLVTNGLKHFCCSINFENESYEFMNHIPFYEELNS